MNSRHPAVKGPLSDAVSSIAPLSAALLVTCGTVPAKVLVADERIMFARCLTGRAE